MSGCSRPAAAPCTARIASSQPKLNAAPPPRLPNSSIAIEPKNTRRNPKRASAQGVVSIAMVLAAMCTDDTHCARSAPTWKSADSAGSATLTMVLVRIAAIVPSITVASAIHL